MTVATGGTNGNAGRVLGAPQQIELCQDVGLLGYEAFHGLDLCFDVVHDAGRVIRVQWLHGLDALGSSVCVGVHCGRCQLDLDVEVFTFRNVPVLRLRAVIGVDLQCGGV